MTRAGVPDRGTMMVHDGPLTAGACGSVATRCCFYVCGSGWGGGGGGGGGRTRRVLRASWGDLCGEWTRSVDCDVCTVSRGERLRRNCEQQAQLNTPLLHIACSSLARCLPQAACSASQTSKEGSFTGRWLRQQRGELQAPVALRELEAPTVKMTPEVYVPWEGEHAITSAPQAFSISLLNGRVIAPPAAAPAAPTAAADTDQY